MTKKLTKSESLARKLDVQAYFATPDKEFEVSLAAFDPPSPTSYHDPGDDGESYPGAIVQVFPDSGEPDYVTYDTFIMDYAVARQINLIDAEREVLEKLHESACLAWTDYVTDSDY